MAVPVEADARRILSPAREEKIKTAFTRAWEDWKSERSKYGRWPRTRANMVFERIAVRLLEIFADDPGVRFHFQNETIKIIFDESLVVRCKKANERGLGDNNRTLFDTAFCEAQGDLPGLPGLQKIEIVYLLNPTETAIEGIVVQARDGDKKLWSYTLGNGRAAATVTPLPRPPAPTYDSREIVNPRAPKNREEKTDEE